MIITISQLRGYQIGPMEKGNKGREQYQAIWEKLEQAKENIDSVIEKSGFNGNCPFWMYSEGDGNWWSSQDFGYRPALSVADFLDATIVEG